MSMSKSLESFLDDASKEHNRLTAISDWHVMAHQDGGWELPYYPTDTWIDCNVYQVDEDGKFIYAVDKDGNKSKVVDVPKTLHKLGLIADFALEKGVKAKKDYSSNFSVKITLPGTEDRTKFDWDVTVTYHANREAVCTKIVTGYEEVEEKVTPAYTKEIVEWECKPISLLAQVRNK